MKSVRSLDMDNCMIFLFSPTLSCTVSFLVWLCDGILCIFRLTNISKALILPIIFLNIDLVSALYKGLDYSRHVLFHFVTNETMPVSAFLGPICSIYSIQPCRFLSSSTTPKNCLKLIVLPQARKCPYLANSSGING